MPKETLTEPFGVQEFFVDGFDGYKVKDGVLTCAGYRTQEPEEGGDPVNVVVLRIVMPAANLPDVISKAAAAASMGGVPNPSIIARRRDKSTH